VCEAQALSGVSSRAVSFAPATQWPSLAFLRVLEIVTVVFDPKIQLFQRNRQKRRTDFDVEPPESAKIRRSRSAKLARFQDG
jgi:hypothetical protein